MGDARNWAIIDDVTNLVVNVVYWDGVTPWNFPVGTYAIDASVFVPEPGVGWVYDRADDVFLCPPAITSLTPSEGPIIGGTSLLLTGLNFTNATSVKVAEVSCSFTIKSATQITAITPKFTNAGEYQIVVSNALQPGSPFPFKYTA